MLLFVALLSAAHPEARVAVPADQTPAIVILGDDARRARVERVLGGLSRAGRDFRRDHASGLWYVGCITAWRDNPGQTEACLRSRLQGGRARPTVVVNTYVQDAEGATSVSCIGIGGTGRASLRDSSAATSTEAMSRCLDRALRAIEGPSPRPFSVPFSDGFEIDDIGQARSRATGVLKVAVDHLGVPRGMTGTCLIQGRVLESERGPSVVPGAVIEVGVPCGPMLGGDRSRRVQMDGLGEGRFARLYLDERRVLLHIEPAGE